MATTRSLWKTIVASLLFFSTQAAAVPVTWTDWVSTGTSGEGPFITGNIGDIAVTVTALSGTFAGPTQLVCGVNYWTQPDPLNPAYTGGSASNAPTACEQVGLYTPVSLSVTFSEAVTNLYMALLRIYP